MKFGRLDISFRRTPKPVGDKSGQPKTFLLAVRKYKDSAAHKVAYSHSPQSGDTSIFVKKVPMEDSLQVAEDIERFIEDRWGGGDWKLQILDSDNLAIATYQKSVPGPLYSTRTGKKREPGDPGRDGSGGGRRSALGDEIDNLGKLAVVVKTMSGDSGGSEMDPFFREILTAQFNNNLSREETRMQEVKSIIEIGQMFSPKVAAEDPWSNVVSALPGIISGIAMMKGGGGPAALPAPGVAALPVSGNGGHDMNSLRNAALSIPPAIIAGLPLAEQAAITKLIQGGPSGAQGSAVLPRPGTSIPGAQVSPQPGVGAGNAGNAAAPPPSPHHAAIDGMILDIRRDLASGAPDSKVGGKMMAMVDFAKRFTSDNPHPVLAGIMTATDATGNQEFANLCNRFPELQGNEARISALGNAILTLMKEGAQETAESLQDVSAEGVISDLQAEPEAGDPPGPKFEYETEADRDAAATAEGMTNVDVSRSAGVRGPGEAQGPGESQDQPDREQVRETA